MHTLLTIGQVAKLSGLTPKAVRLYEQTGLIGKPQRTEAGYRIYQQEDVALLSFIRQARLLGLQLVEIKQIVSLHRSGSRPCQTVLGLLSKRIIEIDNQITELQTLRKTLATVCERAEVNQQKGKSVVICSLLEAV